MMCINVTIVTEGKSSEQILATKKAINKLLDYKHEDPADVTDMDACDALCVVVQRTSLQIQQDEAKSNASIVEI